ncbi:hypothetical protein DFH06DRAFT_1053934, partial [Mycena polygramma]
MPELPESIISGKLPKHFVDQQPAGSLLVRDILADPTIEESATHPLGSPASLGHVYSLESSSGILRGTSGIQTPVYPPLYSTSSDQPPVHILKHGLVLMDVETHPRNALLKFCDNQSRTYWCQVQFLKHTLSQVFPKADWNEAICKVRSTHRGFRIGMALDLGDYVLAFLTLDLLVQFYWSKRREKLPAVAPDVYLEFPRFLDDLVKWMTERRSVQSNRSGNAMTLVRSNTDIFAGAGVYTIAEIWHMAGLSPNLTEAEVFDSPSRTARLCAAYFHFGQEAHTTLWSFVKRFLVGYAICVRDEHRLLYGERLHVYGKDRAYVTARFSALLSKFKLYCDSHPEDAVWVRNPTSLGPFDVFEPDLVCHALENPDINLGSLIFGADLWSELHSQAGLPLSCLSSDNVLARFFAATPIPPAMSATWLDTSAYTFLFNPKGKSARRASHIRTLLYRASATDIWSVIPAYPDNSAPIPRRRPPKVEDNNARKPTKRKVVPPKVKPTPMQECDSTTREKALLSYIIQYTQDYTVGPLDYCGVARLVKGRGPDIIMYCKGDPRVPEFYQRRRALAEVTAKLKRSGEEKHGLSASTIANVDKKLKKVLPVAKVGQTSTTTKENRDDGTTGMMKKKRHSADRDLALEGLVLSPRKRRRI